MTRSRADSLLNDEQKRPPPIQIKDERGKAMPYPQTPILKGRDALSHAFAGFGTSLVSGTMIVLCVMSFTHREAAARTYGLSPTSAWVQLHGIRDGVLGVTTFTLHILNRAALRVWLPLVTLVPLVDSAIIAIWGAGPKSAACQMQIAGACFILLLAVCVYLDPLLPRPGSGILGTGRGIVTSV